MTKLEKKYGISLEDKNRMYESQEGKCAICGEREILRVDHNHITGKVRGLLCDNCNLLIGHANDDENILYEVIDYIRRNK